MKYFHSGFFFASGCLLAILLAWLVTQFFVQLQLQEIDYRGKPRVLYVSMENGNGKVGPMRGAGVD